MIDTNDAPDRWYNHGTADQIVSRVQPTKCQIIIMFSLRNSALFEFRMLVSYAGTAFSMHIMHKPTSAARKLVWTVFQRCKPFVIGTIIGLSAVAIREIVLARVRGCSALVYKHTSVSTRTDFLTQVELCGPATTDSS